MSIYCRGCGAAMHELAGACPACGMPTGTAPAVGPGAADTGWFSFQGRIGRQTYWLKYALPTTAALIAAIIIDTAAGASGLLYLLVSLVVLIPSLAGAVKRLHDRDKSGWFYLIILVPLAGPVWFFIDAGCLPGTQGQNRFGADPIGA